MKKLIILIIVIAVAYGTYALIARQLSNNQPTGKMSMMQAVNSGEVALLDVRTDEEWARGYAKGAMHFDLVRLQAGELPDIAKDKSIYVYCAAGGRAEKAKVILEKAGYTNVINIGGLGDWQDAGGEVVNE
jgi:rhodanese-related sulfurtransferase